MPLVLTNTLTRRKELFTPHNSAEVKMYVCGITPQEAPHLGHGRGYVVSDVLFRVLRATYGAESVVYVRNYTDIDDKIIEKAHTLGQTPHQVAEDNIAIFQTTMRQLNVLPPTFEPRITTSIPEIINFIQILVDKHIAYRTTEGDVYYNLAKLPTSGCGYHYGQLSGKKPEDLLHGSRVEPNPLKQNSGDFALWKAVKPGEIHWESPWGPGRPGWHIECSAMALKHLGPMMDLHGGGEDLQFPHHENELAQNCGAFAGLYSGEGNSFARTWFHWAFITVDGTKMSKSLGNFTYLHQAIATHGAMALRYWLLQTHYRKPVDFSATALAAAGKPAKRIMAALAALPPVPAGAPAAEPEPSHMAPFMAALHDDLNTAKALASLNTALAQYASPATVHAMASLLGFVAAEPTT